MKFVWIIYFQLDEHFHECLTWCFRAVASWAWPCSMPAKCWFPAVRTTATTRSVVRSAVTDTIACSSILSRVTDIFCNRIPMYQVFCISFCYSGYFMLQRIPVSLYLLTCAFSLAGSIGHRPRNATVFCPWPSSPSLSWCIPSPLFLFPCLSARCFVAYLFSSSLVGSMGWLDGWLFLVVTWVCPIHLHFLFFISFSMGCCLVVFRSGVLGTLSVYFRCSILRRHLLMKVCILFSLLVCICYVHLKCECFLCFTEHKQYNFNKSMGCQFDKLYFPGSSLICYIILELYVYHVDEELHLLSFTLIYILVLWLL